MSIDIYIGTERLDFSDNINLVYSIGDIKDLNLGSNNKSYTIDVPLTDNNRKILKYVNTLAGRTEITAVARIFIDGGELLKGKVRVLSADSLKAKIIIEANDWAATLENTKLKDVTGLSAKAVSLTASNVSDSWSAVDPFIRFGMIDFCQRWGQSYLYWITNDFIPAFSVAQLVTLILAPYTIVSTWLASAAAKKLFFLGVEPRVNSDFLQNKGLEVTPVDSVENSGSWVLPHGSGNHTFTYDPISFLSETKDEGDDFVGGVYTVPVTGTYRFKLTLHEVFGSEPNQDYDWDDGEIDRECSILTKVGGAGSAITLATHVVENSVDMADVNSTISLDTGWVHLTAGDTVYCYYTLFCEVENTNAADETFTSSITLTSKFENTWDHRNLYAGVGKSLNPADYMPDRTALEFLQAVKHLENLVFFIDRRKNNIYIEPSDTFFTENVIDLTDKVINLEELFTEPIAANYTKNLIFGLAEDLNDKAYNEYVSENGIPYQKSVALSSVYVKEGTTKMLNNFFASTITKVVSGLPTIYGNEEYLSTNYAELYPVKRPVNYTPRIFTWEGLTAGANWYYNTVLKTTYPKMGIIDFSTLYDLHYLKTIHYIDKCKSARVKIRTTPLMLMQFMGVIAASESEGFRAKYMIFDGKEYHYLILQGITTNGEIAEGNLILK